MSTPMDNVAGKGRSQSTTLWLWVLAVSLLLFAGNTGYALWKAARFGGATTAASNLQVNSQKLANQGREAVNGDAAAMTAFKATKSQIESDVKSLNDRFGTAPDVSGSIETVTATQVPLGKNADQIIASERTVLAFADNAKRFTDRVPQLQGAARRSGARDVGRRCAVLADLHRPARWCWPATSPAAWPKSAPAARAPRWPATRSAAMPACSRRCSTACATATTR